MKRNMIVVVALVLVVFAGLLQAQNTVTDWNAIASNTIIKVGGMGPSPAGIYFAYASIASYDAVNAIDRDAQPFFYDGRAWPRASKDAAAATAAHDVLAYYFPKQQTALGMSLQATLDGISAPQSEKDAGVSAGQAAAAALISNRANDGLLANVTYTPRTGPGAWQPTPPGFLAPATPWVGQMQPFTMSSASQFLPAGPTPLDSAEWERDYTITRLLGAKDGSARTPKQTEIGIFWTENTAQQYARLSNNLAMQNNLDVEESARFIAMFWTAYADAAIGCYNAKYTYGFWRPVTAIPAGGGNTDLASDAAWTPLATTPNHPEYPAAHACLTGAASTVIAEYFHTSQLPLMVDSVAFSPAHQHTFANTDDFLNEVQWARIYAGFHYYHSVVDGGNLGKSVAQNLVKKYFQQTRDRKRADD
jgi:hypothetical protein